MDYRDKSSYHELDLITFLLFNQIYHHYLQFSLHNEPTLEISSYNVSCALVNAVLLSTKQIEV